MKHKYEQLVKVIPELKYDPFVKRMLMTEQIHNEMELMHPMSQTPTRSGYIILLHNRVLLRSVGNARYCKRMYFDARSRMVGEELGKCDIPFRMARLKCNLLPAGWIYEDGRV